MRLAFERKKYAALCAEIMERMTGERCGIEFHDYAWIKLVRYTGERKIYV